MEETMVIQIVLAVLLLLVMALYRKLTKSSGMLEGMGIPVDPMSFLTAHKTDFKKHDEECMKKYGRVWGHYSGSTPEIFLADTELLKELMVKRFDDFTDRQHFDMLPEKHTSLIDGRKPYWKDMRKALSPTFTSGKLKGMFHNLDNVVDKMVVHMAQKAKDAKDGVVDVKPIFQSLSLDSISNCAFGIETDSFNNPDNKLFTTCQAIFSNFFILKSAFDSFFFVLSAHFPFLDGLKDVYGADKWDYLWTTTKDIAESRKKAGNSNRNDFVDRLNEIKDGGVLNEAQTYAQGIGFFQAGFETTSNTMSTLTYALAKNPQVQETLFEEVKRVMSQFDGRIDHETVSHLHYAEAAIYENLRIHGPVIRVDRQCLKDSQLGPYSIKKGTLIQVPIWAIHHSPEFYDDPMTFDPERFLGDEGKKRRNELSYLAFGGGPRVCIGMRFAMAEMLISLAKFVSNFKILDSPDTELRGNMGDPFFFSYPEVKVKLEKRSC